jgi:hypothetical protein
VRGQGRAALVQRQAALVLGWQAGRQGLEMQPGRVRAQAR